MMSKCSKKCKLSKLNMQVVRSKGKFPSDILLLIDFPSIADEHTGIIGSGDIHKMFSALLHEAKQLFNLPKFTFSITAALQCRPTDTLRGDTREPLPNEMIQCKDKVLRLIKLAKPKIIFISGEFAKKYYEKELFDAIHIISLQALIDTGYQKSPYFKSYARVIAENLNRKL